MNSLERRPSPRVQKKRRQARAEILAAARGILLEDGPDAVTLASVAGRLDITKQALYHYFPSKEALARSLVTALIEEEIETLVTAIEGAGSNRELLGAMIRSFYMHYRERLNAFRFVYCQSQLYTATEPGVDAQTIRENIAPTTRQLFDVLESRMAGESMSAGERAQVRRLAYTAWSSALGLMSILGIADATHDPLMHSDEDLLDTLATVFDQAV